MVRSLLGLGGRISLIMLLISSCTFEYTPPHSESTQEITNEREEYSVIKSQGTWYTLFDSLEVYLDGEWQLSQDYSNVFIIPCDRDYCPVLIVESLYDIGEISKSAIPSFFTNLIKQEDESFRVSNIAYEGLDSNHITIDCWTNQLGYSLGCVEDLHIYGDIGYHLRFFVKSDEFETYRVNFQRIINSIRSKGS